MTGSERRRSVRHLLGTTAEVHLGPRTVKGVVQDVSRHGMGILLPDDVQLNAGDLVWIVSHAVAPYAITATARRIGEGGFVGLEFEEVLTGDALDKIEALPLPLGDVDMDTTRDESAT